jgi:hypothetical protein
VERWLAPAVDVADDGAWITKLRAEPMDHRAVGEVAAALPPGLLQLEEGYSGGRANNWGRLPDGRVVLIDYVYLGMRRGEPIELTDQYQDIWCKGARMSRGYRNCEERYAAIETELAPAFAPLDRAPRILDVGSHLGYFSLRLAETFGAFCVAVEDYADIRLVLDRNANPLVSLNARRIDTPEQVRALGVFDAALALAVLHYMPEHERILDAFQEMTRGPVIVEVRTEYVDVMRNRGARLMAELPKDRERPEGPLRPIYVLEGRA